VDVSDEYDSTEGTMQEGTAVSKTQLNKSGFELIDFSCLINMVVKQLSLEWRLMGF